MRSGTKPLVAIVGRPNVGKSTLFNRLAGRPQAIVSEMAGTTRDRVTTEAVWGDQPFILVDTGGLDKFPETETEIWRKTLEQIDVSLADADVVIMLVDAEVGPTPADVDVADTLRTVEKPVILAVNKADNQMREAQANDFYELGMGDPLPVSAYHNRGIDELMTRVIKALPVTSPFEEPEADLRLAIVGRTNVGKSMLLNAITGEERSIVSEVPGTTRDALDTLIAYDKQTVLLVDTAGLRRRGSIKPGVERYSALRAVRAIDRAEVAILVLDASELATNQDAHIASYILEAYRGIVLMVNKWDLAPKLGMSKEQATTRIRERFNFVRFAPICFVSALRGTGITTLMDKTIAVSREWKKELPRYGLRRTILNAVSTNPPATARRHALKIFGVTQDQSGPPSFTFYVNHSNMVHFGYRRYLENALRKVYEFEGSPLRMRFKSRGER